MRWVFLLPCLLSASLTSAQSLCATSLDPALNVAARVNVCVPQTGVQPQQIQVSVDGVQVWTGSPTLQASSTTENVNVYRTTSVTFTTVGTHTVSAVYGALNSSSGQWQWSAPFSRSVTVSGVTPTPTTTASPAGTSVPTNGSQIVLSNGELWTLGTQAGVNNSLMFLRNGQSAGGGYGRLLRVCGDGKMYGIGDAVTDYWYGWSGTAWSGIGTTAPCAGLSQPAPPPPTTCTISVSPLALSFPKSASTRLVTVTTPSGCPWSSFDTATWLRESLVAGVGPVSVSVNVTRNRDAARTATLTVSGTVVSVQQASGR